MLCSIDDSAEIMDDMEYKPGADLDVIFGSWKKRNVPHHNLKRDIVDNSKNVVVIETPLLHRGPVKEVMGDSWFRVGLNGFMRNADYVSVTKGRKSFMLTDKILSENQDSKQDEDYILVVLQLPGDASLDFFDINEWCVDTVKAIRKTTDRDIVIRYPQLPREFSFMEKIADIDNIYYQNGTYEDRVVTLNNAYAVVTFSSGMGVEAILNGNRTHVYSKNGFWSKQSSLDEVLNKNYLNFDQDVTSLPWRRSIESTQWHEEEIKSGKCIAAIKEMING